jgi:uncharacterized protein (DUF1697 family)
MKRYVALLRGINVGGNNKVAMSKLRTLFSSLGFGEVSTYINSGNVIFTSIIADTSLLQRIIEKNIFESFRLQIPILVRDSATIQKVCKALPESLHNNKETKTDILFLWDRYANKQTLNHIQSNKEVDTLIYISGSIIWSVERSNYAKSGMKKFIGSEIYKNMTARNSNTVKKLGELLQTNPPLQIKFSRKI